MNITTDLKHNSPQKNLPDEGYEWWYFDGQSQSGDIHFVIIFYQSNPFSVNHIKELTKGDVINKHPAVSVSIYHESKPVYYSFLEFEESSFSWNESKQELKIEGNEFSYEVKDGELLVEIILDQKLASGHSIKGCLRGAGAKSSSNLIHSESKDRHAWNLLLPRMDWSVDLKLYGRRGGEELVFEGVGYHDHNTGEEPMKDSFQDWYWGRYHFEEFTLVYYLMQKHGKQQMEGWLIDKENTTVLEHFTRTELSHFSNSMFGLKVAQQIELHSSQSDVNIAHKNKIDNGPFYQRFKGNSILNYNGQVYAAQGISEYIYPENIYERKFWPLVHMRLRYMYEEPHWVQKSKIMYPWTW